jgi:hypothetical protein
MRILATLSLSSILVALVACGTADPNGSKYGTGDPSKGGIGKGDNTGGENGLGGDNSKKPAGDFAACATATAGADAKPVYLVFVYDQSGSMNDNGKWDAAKDAMKSFFTSADSKGISASLAFFPLGNNATFCNTSLYSNPSVSVTALPSDSFGNALDNTQPNGPTPTASALQGAINYAQSIQGTTAKDGTVAVVMVTDGIPQGCNDDNDPSVAAGEAANVSSSIKTYVVGVGDQLGALDDIAKSGGTTSATRVSVGDPAQTQQDLSKAINQIRASALSCDYGIPAAPNGQSLDPAKVNVQYTPTGGSPSPLQHNQSCSGGTGWKYDNEQNPTRILVCDGSCNDIKSKAGKVDVVFGCATVNAGVQ